MIVPTSLSAIRDRKLSALSDFQRSMGLIVGDQEKLRAELLEAAPKELRWFLTEDRALHCLFEYGLYGGKVKIGQPYGTDSEEGFTSVTSLENAFVRLKRAWNGAVEIKTTKIPNGVEVDIKLP